MTNRFLTSASPPDAASSSAPYSRMVSSILYRVGWPTLASSLVMTDLSTSRITVSKIWAAVSSPPAHTSSAASTLKLPAKTDSRAHSACSAGVHRS